MATAIVIIILTALVALSLLYMIRARKRGKGCVGCPYAGQCGKGTCDHQQPPPQESDREH